MSAYVYISLDPQKKTQKRKFQDEDMETESQLKYKGMAEHAEIALVIIVS